VAGTAIRRRADDALPSIIVDFLEARKPWRDVLQRLA